MALVAHTEDESLLFGGVMHEGEVSKKLETQDFKCNGSFTNCSGYYFSKTGVHYHVCHVSSRSVRVIRDVQKQGFT